MTCSLYSGCFGTGSLRLLFCEIRVKHGGRGEIQFKNTEETPSEMSVPEYVFFFFFFFFLKELLLLAKIYGLDLNPFGWFLT